MTDRQTDGRTDGQTDRILITIPRLHYMQRGKKNSNGLYKPVSDTGEHYILTIENMAQSSTHSGGSVGTGGYCKTLNFGI